MGVKFLQVFFIFSFLHIYIPCLANDGAFRANGNQLIPMYETDISVTKEILTIRRINSTQAQITVYYEFFNPRDSKSLEVGFEAFSPSGDANHTPGKDGQPYISHFTVTLNGTPLQHSVSIVSDSLYYRNGKYKAKTLAQAIKESNDNDYVDFFYVYHFHAVFTKGINIIQHTYIVDLSSSIVETYSLDYVLTAAKRWANRQIDDFTLQIDMGDFQDLSIENTFFNHASDWTIAGVGRSLDRKADHGDKKATDTAEFFIKKGMLVFKKTNFKPAGELNMHSLDYYYFYSQKVVAAGADDGSPKFDCRHDPLPFSIEDQHSMVEPADELSKKVLRNLPFARRGYVFKSPEIQSYYERQPWYLPDPAYTPVAGQLTRKEQEWLNK